MSRILIKMYKEILIELCSISPSYLILTLISAVLNSTYKVLFIYLTKVVIEIMSNGNIINFNIIIFISSTVGILFILLTSIVKNRYLPIMENNISEKIYKNIYKEYYNHDLNTFYADDNIDQYYSIIDNTVNSVKSVINTSGNILEHLFTSGGILGIFIGYRVDIILLIIFSVLISFLLRMKKEKKSYEISMNIIPYERKLNYIRRIFYEREYEKELRLHSINVFFSYIDKIYNSINKYFTKESLMLVIIDFLSDGIMLINTVAILVILGISVIRGEINIAVFSMLFSGAQQITNEINSFLGSMPIIYNNCLFYNNYYEFKKNKDIFGENIDYVETTIEKIRTIEIDNLSFSYDCDNVIENFNLHIDKPGIYKIKGGNGTGKSTLISLLLRLLTGYRGNIKINNIEIDKYNIDEYRKKFSVLLQDYKLFPFSIKENILINSGTNDIDIDYIIDILDELNIKDKLMSIEGGIDAVMFSEFGNNNINLSLGEMQKIAICRAIINQTSDVIILDEPLNHLDVESKIKVKEILQKHCRDKIVILISHDDDIIYGDSTQFLKEICI